MKKIKHVSVREFTSHKTGVKIDNAFNKILII